MQVIELAPRVGIEPTTRRLTVVCSTAELPGNRAGLEGRGFSGKALCRVKELGPRACGEAGPQAPSTRVPRAVRARRA